MSGILFTIIWYLYQLSNQDGSTRIRGGGTSLPQDEDALSLINYLFCRSFCVGQAYMNLREASLPQESSLTR